MFCAGLCGIIYVKILGRNKRDERSGIFVGKTEIVGYHSDKFAVCRFTSVVLHRESEVGIQGIYISAVPCDLDRMSYRTFNS